MDAVLQKMKIALRVRSDRYDEEIKSVIGAAGMELVRAGVKPEKAQDYSDDLILSAIRAYVLAQYSTDTKMTEGYWRSFAYQTECLRKSTGYGKELTE